MRVSGRATLCLETYTIETNEPDALSGLASSRAHDVITLTNMPPEQGGTYGPQSGFGMIDVLAKTTRKIAFRDWLLRRLAGDTPAGLPECMRQMPDMHLTACPVSCICPICQEHQRAKHNNGQPCFHDDLSAAIPFPPQARSRERERVRSAWDSRDTRIPAG